MLLVVLVGVSLGIVVVVLLHIFFDSKKRRIDLTQDALSDNISYGSGTYGDIYFYRLDEILWQGHGYILGKTKRGRFILTRHDKVLSMTHNKSTMFKRLAEAIGVKEALQVVHDLNWKVKVNEL